MTCVKVKLTNQIQAFFCYCDRWKKYTRKFWHYGQCYNDFLQWFMIMIQSCLVKTNLVGHLGHKLLCVHWKKLYFVWIFLQQRSNCSQKHFLNQFCTRNLNFVVAFWLNKSPGLQGQTNEKHRFRDFYIFVIFLPILGQNSFWMSRRSEEAKIYFVTHILMTC